MKVPSTGKINTSISALSVVKPSRYASLLQVLTRPISSDGSSIISTSILWFILP